MIVIVVIIVIIIIIIVIIIVIVAIVVIIVISKVTSLEAEAQLKNCHRPHGLQLSFGARASFSLPTKYKTMPRQNEITGIRSIMLQRIISCYT